MPKDRLSKRDLEEFAGTLHDELVTRFQLAPEVTWDYEETVGVLWELLTKDLPRYAHGQGRPRIQMHTAETGVDWNEALTTRFYLQTEGAEIARTSLIGLPTTNTDWDYSLFGYREDVWYLFKLWIEALKNER